MSRRPSEPLIDMHVHLLMPDPQTENEHPWVPPRYHVPVDRFVGDHPIRRIIMEALREAGLPVLPHWIEALEMVASSGPLDRAVILTVDENSGIFPDHDTMLRLVEAFPQHVLGSVSVNPDVPGSKKILEYKLASLLDLYERLNLGWRPIVKFDFTVQNFHPAAIPGDIWGVAQECKAVAVCHTGPLQLTKSRRLYLRGDPTHLLEAVETHPGLDFVLAHMGTPDHLVQTYYSVRGLNRNYFSSAVTMLSEFPNVWGDLAGLAWVCEDGFDQYTNKNLKRKDMIGRSVAAFLYFWLAHSKGRSFCEKIVFGSDFPLTTQGQLKKQELLLGFNPARNTARLLRRRTARVRAR